MKPAVFLDRDGTINANLFRDSTKSWEAPVKPEEMRIADSALDALYELQKKNYLLFLVSNQPDYAKGKAKLQDLKEVHAAFHAKLLKRSIHFTEYYYCYHHPQGIAAGFSGPCACRKPGIYFLKEAEQSYCVDLKNSWMAGDREIDVLCGKGGGVRTIRIFSSNSPDAVPETQADFKAGSLKEAAEIMMKKGPA